MTGNIRQVNTKDIIIIDGMLFYKGHLVGPVNRLHINYTVLPCAPLNLWPPGALKLWKEQFGKVDIKVTDKDQIRVEMKREDGDGTR